MAARASEATPQPLGAAAAMAAWRRLLQAVRRRDRIAERDTGLTGAQLYALRQLAAHPGSTVGELAAYTATDASSSSAVASRLLQKQLIDRVRDTVDHRRWRLVLTEAGWGCVAAAPESSDARLERALGLLPTSDRLELVQRLRSLASALDLDAAERVDRPREGNRLEKRDVSLA